MAEQTELSYVYGAPCPIFLQDMFTANEYIPRKHGKSSRVILRLLINEITQHIQLCKKAVVSCENKVVRTCIMQRGRPSQALVFRLQGDPRCSSRIRDIVQYLNDPPHFGKQLALPADCGAYSPGERMPL